MGLRYLEDEVGCEGSWSGHIKFHCVFSLFDRWESGIAGLFVLGCRRAERLTDAGGKKNEEG